MIKRLFVLFYFISLFCYTQNLRQIDTVDYKFRNNLIEIYKKENTLFYKNLKTKYKGKLRKEITNVYKSSDEEFLKTIQKKRFIFDQRFTKYADSITKLLTKTTGNTLENNIVVYISKNPNINALNIGKGVILLNIGLFKYFENEDQLISVLAHEIAHEKLNHVANSVRYIARLRTSKKRKTQAKNIRRKKYNQYDKSFKILKDLMYSDSKVRRRREIQADSVGYLLYKNTALNNTNYTSALELLAKYETLPTIELDSTIYRAIFNLPNQKFKNSWLKMEEFKSYDYSQYTEKINTDSVKSHPEFTERILKLKKSFPELATNDTTVVSKKSKSFLELQSLARKEDIVNLYDLEEYGKSIQLILNKLSKNPNDDFLKKWLGENFLKLYEAKKKYQLNRYIDRINPKEQTQKYQQFISFIWNLNLNEIKIIGDYYSKNQ